MNLPFFPLLDSAGSAGSVWPFGGWRRRPGFYGKILHWPVKNGGFASETLWVELKWEIPPNVALVGRIIEVNGGFCSTPCLSSRGCKNPVWSNSSTNVQPKLSESHRISNHYPIFRRSLPQRYRTVEHNGRTCVLGARLNMDFIWRGCPPNRPGTVDQILVRFSIESHGDLAIRHFGEWHVTDS